MRNNSFNLKDCIIITLDGKITEPLTQLMGVLYLKSKGYLVTDSYSVLSMKNEGIPDIIAIKSEILEKLRERSFISNGCTLTDLSTLRVLGKTSTVIHNITKIPETLVMEVKSSIGSIN